MSDLNEWLRERRTIHDAATGGPWEVERHAPEDSDYQSFGVGAGDVYVVFELPWDAAGAGSLDAEAIVDAHSTLPALLTAVEGVLEQVEWMESDAELYHNTGYEVASECLTDYALTIRQQIEGAINE